MLFDRILHRLLPTDERFYSLFEDATRNLLSAAETLRELSKAKLASDKERLAVQIHALEHIGDDLTHRIYSELNSTFVTPFDREDIHELGSSVDDVLDEIDGSIGRIVLYRIKKLPSSVTRLIDILHLSIEQLHRGVHLLRNIHKTDELYKVLQKVNEYENEADAVFERAVADLFDHEKNPVQIIKLKEVLVGLETATDKCEDAANVMEGILIKHA
jgi:predicted phosphate transport protein (TIGR00153 family)